MDPQSQTPPPTEVRTANWAVLRHPSAVVAECLAVLFALVIVIGRQYPPDARLFPTVVSVLGLFLCAVFLAASVLNPTYARKNIDDMEEAAGDIMHFWIACVSPPLYSIGIYVIGFHAATFIAMLVMPAVLGYPGWLRRAGIAFAVVLALHLVFVVAVDIDLPSGLLGNYVLTTFVYDK